MVECPCWVSGERVDDKTHGVAEGAGAGDEQNGSAMGNAPILNCLFISLI